MFKSLLVLLSLSWLSVAQDSCVPTSNNPCRARASLTTGGQGVSGDVYFEQAVDGGVRVSGTINGLEPGQHGFHIHQSNDLSNGCTSTGPHFNPDSVTHGGLESTPRHVGDLGNIVAAANRSARVDIVDSKIQLSGPNSILNRAVVVHAGQDDLGTGTGDKAEESKRTGNAGARLACGIIELQPANRNSAWHLTLSWSVLMLPVMLLFRQV